MAFLKTRDGAKGSRRIMNENKPKRSEPYVAPGAPKSPRVIAIASAIVAVTALAANLFHLEVDLDAELVVSVVAFVYAIVGTVQDRGARAEQAAGVAALAKARAELHRGAVAGDSMGEAVLE